MKSLSEYINEGKTDFYGTVIQSIDIDPNTSEDKLIKILNDSLKKAIDKYKIIRISAVEKANEEADINSKKLLDDALKKGEKDIIKSMQSKPGILKRSPEKQRAWIDSKIEKLKSELGKKYPYVASHCKIEFDDNEMRFGWHNDIYSNQRYSEYRGVNRLNEVVETIANEISTDKDYKHLKSVQVLAKDFTGPYPRLDIFPMFDDEFEKKLAKSVKDFGEFMSREYQSGRYMGD